MFYDFSCNRYKPEYFDFVVPNHRQKSVEWQKSMAAVCVTADMTILKNSQILVNVDEALPDLLVVSYSAADKTFQGVLLDSSKSNLPFGVYNLHPAFSKSAADAEEHNDKLHAVSQRFRYEDPDYTITNGPKKAVTKGKAQQKQKMTVRLRPRKVLCSNCQGICNENSENVDVSKKRKLISDDEKHDVTILSQTKKKKYLLGPSLIPKLSRLDPEEISSAIKGTKNSNKASEKPNKSLKIEKYIDSEKITPELTFVSVTDIIEKKDTKEDTNATLSNLFSNARTLKICFGEGEGTVVKIPPISGDHNEDSGVSCDMAKSDLKAAKKAIKKAKRQAKKNNNQETKVVEWNLKSPKHVGALSPHNNLDNSPPLEKKHKHKVKHKKKHKIPRKRDENTSKVAIEDNAYFSDVKDNCIQQKLSINLRRLSSNSFDKQQEAVESGSDDWEGETVPEFPENGSESAGGKLLRVSPGDIVWGKVIGFPWWPGRVLSVTSASKAHVEWFASTTSSLMSFNSLSPFLEDFKIRFNKKKRGAYKEAVKLATMEAKKGESQLEDPLASPKDTLTTSPCSIGLLS